MLAGNHYKPGQIRLNLPRLGMLFLVIHTLAMWAQGLKIRRLTRRHLVAALSAAPPAHLAYLLPAFAGYHLVHCDGINYILPIGFPDVKLCI